MDRRAAFGFAQRVRRTEGRLVGSVGRLGRGEGRRQYPAGEGDGRLHRRLWAEWRADTPAAGFSVAPGGSGIRRDLQHQMVAADQGRGPLLHDVQRLWTYFEG